MPKESKQIPVHPPLLERYPIFKNLENYSFVLTDQEFVTSFTDPDYILGAGDLTVTLSAKPKESDQTPSSDVALKILAPKKKFQRYKGEELEQIFQQEANLLEAADHPHLPVFYKQTEIAGKPAIIREKFVSSVADLDTELSHTQIKQLMQQIGSALTYLAEEHRVLVTDIAPSNIFQRVDGNFALGDLNLAAWLDQPSWIGLDSATAPPELTKMGVANLKLGPETIKAAIKPTAQVYMLGRTYYYLLGGSKPSKFDIMIDGLPAITKLPGENLANELLHVLQKATAEDPKERYQSVDEFIRAIV